MRLEKLLEKLKFQLTGKSELKEFKGRDSLS
jgi:hypothetical protein